MFLNHQGIIIEKKKIILAVITLIIVFGVVFLGVVYFLQEQKIQRLQKELNARQTNVKIVNFLDTFVKKVLKAEGEVSFEDRLKLENAVRDLNDKELLSLWEKFTQAQTSEQIQQNVKNLLEGLVNKIMY